MRHRFSLCFGNPALLENCGKLEIKDVSHQTVRNILKERGDEPGPDCTSDSWTDFLNRHGETYWSCDFFSAKSMTTSGMHDLYVLVFPKQVGSGSDRHRVSQSRSSREMVCIAISATNSFSFSRTAPIPWIQAQGNRSLWHLARRDHVWTSDIGASLTGGKGGVDRAVVAGVVIVGEIAGELNNVRAGSPVAGRASDKDKIEQ